MRDRIRDILDQYTEAVWNKDVEAFLALYDDNIRDYDAWEQWEYAGIHEFRTLPVNWFRESEGHRVKVTFMYPEIHQSGHLAAVWSQVVYSAYDERDRLKHFISNRMTLVLEKPGNDWKIIHEHTSVPVDQETGQGVFKNHSLEQSVTENPDSAKLPYNSSL